jgi:hypothetical protein
MRAALLLVLVLVACPGVASAQCLAAHGAVIARDCASLEVSRDDGRTFVDTGLEVAAVTVTSDGRVVAVTEAAGLPTLFEVGGTAREVLPLADVQALASVGRAVVVVGTAPADGEHLTVLVRPPGGTSPLRVLGRARAWSSAMEVSVTGTERDPHVEVVLFYGLSCWGTVAVRRVSLDARHVEMTDLVEDEDCANRSVACAGFTDLEIGAHGSAYARPGLDRQGEVRAGPLVLVRPVERASPTSLHAATDANVTVAHNGALTFALVDGALHRLEGSRATRLAGTIEPEAHLVYVDPRGRPYAETARGLSRYSRRGGWAPLP